MRPPQVWAPKLNHRLIQSVALSALMLWCLKVSQKQSVVASSRMIRLCIASVDPARLSSQCVMCARREFPVTAIDCTGMNKMHDLIANPLSVEEATCLIYNCRKKIPYIRPEPYHGSISHAAARPQTSGSSNFQVPSGNPFGGGFGGVGSGAEEGSVRMYPPMGYQPGAGSHYSSASSPFQMSALPGGAGLGSAPFGTTSKGHPLPYAIVPAMQITPFGLRKYRNALIPLFR